MLRASLLVVQAQSSPEGAQRRDQARRAVDDFASATAVNPALEKAWKTQAVLAQQLAGTPR